MEANTDLPERYRSSDWIQLLWTRKQKVEITTPITTSMKPAQRNC